MWVLGVEPGSQEEEPVCLTTVQSCQPFNLLKNGTLLNHSLKSQECSLSWHLQPLLALGMLPFYCVYVCTMREDVLAAGSPFPSTTQVAGSTPSAFTN